VLAREVPLALTMYIDLAEKSKRAGKPIDWFSMDPAVAQGFNIAWRNSRRIECGAAVLRLYVVRLKPSNCWRPKSIIPSAPRFLRLILSWPRR